MNKRPRQPPPGHEGGVGNTYEGPLDYDPESGQYFDLAKKSYIDIETGEYFDLEPDEKDSHASEARAKPSALGALFNRLASFRAAIVDALTPDNRPTKEETRAVIRRKLDQIKNS